MIDVNKVYITKEVAEKLDLNPSYLIRVAKNLYDNGIINSSDMRSAGKRNYLFNDNAVEIIKNNLKRK